MNHIRLALAGWLLLAASACGDDGSTPDDAGADASAVDSGSGDTGAVDAPPGPDAGPGCTHVDPGRPENPVGEILLLELEGFGRSTGWLRGRIQQSGLVPIHDVAMDDGTCRLLTYRPGSCTDCWEGICYEPAECRPFPMYDNAGSLSIGGIGPRLDIMFDSLFGYYGSSTNPDLFEPCAEVSAEASGGDVAAFRVSARGVLPIEVDLPRDEITLTDGEDFVFGWTPAGMPGARVRITINANNSGHGYPYAAILECDAPDETGSVSIPAAMIDAFPPTSRWEACAGSDCPLSQIMRYTRGTVESGTGQIELLVGNGVEFFVVHNPP